MDFGTSYGLALSSGVNAYFPLLAFAIAARWLHLYKVNPNFSFVTNTWFMITLAILTLADLFADKIPIVDHVWDAIHIILRPIAGALVAAASGSQVSGAGIPATMLIGAALAGMTHTTKAATRVASTATTAGLFNVVLSVIEDFLVVITTALSLFAPYVMLILIGLFVLVFLVSVRRIIALLSRRRQRARISTTMRI